MTILATPTSLTSSMYGCAAPCGSCSQIYSARLPYQSWRNWWPRPTGMAARERAEAFFLDGMTLAMQRLAVQAHPALPVTVYYAFKQSESRSDDGVVSTGWETFLDAVNYAGFAVTGTWPIRTELGNRMVGMGTNALASSIVLVCRPRPVDAPMATRRQFLESPQVGIA